MTTINQDGLSPGEVADRRAAWDAHNARVADGTVAEEEANSRFDTPGFKDLKALALVVADIANITPAALKAQFIAKRKALR